MLISNLHGPDKDREFKSVSSGFKELSLFQDMTHKSLLALVFFRGKVRKGGNGGEFP